MNMAHWHLVLNHVPMFLTLFGIVLLVVGLWRNSDELTVTSLVMFVLAGAVVVPVYYTGHEAEGIVEDRPAVSEPLLEQHEELAEWTRLILIVLGLVSLGALSWLIKGNDPSWVYGITLAISLLGTGYLGYTAYLGGQIRHSEIRPTKTNGLPGSEHAEGEPESDGHDYHEEEAE
ncbi:MAG: hypothetical protein ABEK50_11740 [bacterium]